MRSVFPPRTSVAAPSSPKNIDHDGLPAGAIPFTASGAECQPSPPVNRHMVSPSRWPHIVQVPVLALTVRVTTTPVPAVATKAGASPYCAMAKRSTTARGAQPLARWSGSTAADAVTGLGNIVAKAGIVAARAVGAKSFIVELHQL